VRDMVVVEVSMRKVVLVGQILLENKYSAEETHRPAVNGYRQPPSVGRMASASVNARRGAYS
jgi:hypothetical protein